jgi:putative Mg2+ transporter-C (MgtC) family protein
MDWEQSFSFLRRIAAAFGLSLPVAYVWERLGRSAGLRTFPLVAVASCAYLLIAESWGGTGAEAQSRVLQGLMGGMGFIGGGAILRTDSGVRGTATAASLWTVGAIGAATAFSRYDIAIMLSALNLVTLAWLTRLKPLIHKEPDADASAPSVGPANRSAE